MPTQAKLSEEPQRTHGRPFAVAQRQNRARKERRRYLWPRASWYFLLCGLGKPGLNYAVSVPLAA
jgi:hypothetical protein